MKSRLKHLNRFLLALTLSFVVSACGLKNGKDATDRKDGSVTGGGSLALRREAFRTTLYPIVKRDCTECHVASQAPTFAASDVGVAFNAVMPTVNWESLSSSKLVARSTDSHCGRPSCATDGSLFLSAVKAMDDQWKQGTAGSILVKWDAAVDSGTEEALVTTRKEASFTLSRAVDRELTISYQVSGTATLGVDHELAATGEVVIPALEKTGKIAIPVLDDALFEPDETIVLKLLPAEGIEISGSDTFTLTVQNDADPAPSVQWKLTSSSVNEGASATLEAELSGACSVDVSVPVTVAVPAGVAAADMQLSNATLRIPAGMLTGSVTLSRVQNTLDEVDAVVTVGLGNPTNATLGANTTHSLTVADDDAAPAVQWALASSSVNETVGMATFNATLSAVSTKTVTVSYQISGAVDAAQRGFSNGSVTIAPGQSSGSFQVAVTNDLTFEGPESIIMTLSSPVNASLGARTTHTVALVDDETAPLADWSLTSSSASESAGTVNITARLSRASQANVTLNYTVAGTSTSADHALAAGSFTIAAGDTTDMLSFNLTNDVLDETDETVVVTLASVTGASLGTNLIHTLTITDDDASPDLNFVSAAQTVGENAGTVTATVSLSAASGGAVSVPYTVSGTATNPADHNLAAGTLSFPAGTTSKTISFSVAQDSTPEADQTVIITLGTPTAATLGTGQVHTVTITENTLIPIVQWGQATRTVAEGVGSVVIPVTLSSQSSSAITVPVAVSGTATAADFTLSSATLSVPANSATGSVTLTVTQDTMDENDETVILTLGTPTNASLGATSVQTITLTDDDNAPNVHFNAATQTVVEGATGAVTVTAALSAASGKAVSVPFTVSGTASRPGDHNLVNGTFNFAAGATAAMVLFNQADDTIFEGNETIILTLGTATNATVNTPSVLTLTITDNEAMPAVQWAIASQTKLENAGTVQIAANLNRASTAAISVPYVITGTATSTDHNLADGTLQFPAGSLSASVVLTLLNDTVDEDAETVILTLGAPTGATKGATVTHTLTITDDDPLPVVTFSAAAQTVAESSTATLTTNVRLNTVSGRDVTIPIAVSGSASQPSDHNLTVTSVVIPKGTLSVPISFRVFQDTVYEGTESIVIKLGAPMNAAATLGTPAEHIVSIADDDAPPVLLVGGNLALQSFKQYEEKLTNLFDSPIAVNNGVVYNAALQVVSDDGDPGEFSDPMASAYVAAAHAHCRAFVVAEGALAQAARTINAGADLSVYANNTEATKRTVIRRYVQALWTRDPLATEETILLQLMDATAATVLPTGSPSFKAHVSVCTAVAGSPEGIRN